MKESSFKTHILIAFLILTCFVGCEKDEDPVVLPLLATLGANNITTNFANSGGLISDNGGGQISERGVCWSTSTNSTIEEAQKTIDGKGIGSYTSSLNGLISGTTYFVRAYASNEAGTAYGNEITFKTSNSFTELLTTEVSDITYQSAKSGGEVLHDGGTSVTSRGVCWGNIENPTIESNKFTQDGNDIGVFTSELSDLDPGATYFVRSYAVNEVGVSYGDQHSFTTLKTIPAISTNEPSAITTISALSGGKITSNGGAEIIDSGLCYSTQPEPSISNSKIQNTSGDYEFTLNMQQLSLGTTYYIRAYAINSQGTSYGQEYSFTTKTSNFTIGQVHEGGVIFYLDESGEHGLIVCTIASAEQEDAYNGGYSVWGCVGVNIPGSDAIEIGGGMQNTLDNVNYSCGPSTAADLCYYFIINGISDWFLPSKNELQMIYEKLSPLNLEIFENNYYWSSSEIDLNKTWVINPITGNEKDENKSSNIRSVAVREF